jgi:fibronectin type 3 domain-containing protein
MMGSDSLVGSVLACGRRLAASTRARRRAALLALAILAPACGGGGGGHGLLTPPPPAGVAPAAGEGLVVLAWTPNGATSYDVKRSTTAGGPYILVATVSGNSYTDSGLTDGTTYYYVISGINGFGEGGDSTQVSATPAQAGSIAVPPTGLAGTAGDQQVALTWTASSGAASYNLKSASSGAGPYTTVVNTTSTSYTNTGLVNGTAVFYEVTAVNSLGESAPSAPPVSVTPTAPAVAPSAPSLSGTAGDNQVALSWSTSTGASTYNVQRGASAGTETNLVTGLTTTTYTDSTAANGTTYFYRVVAVTPAFPSGTNSNEISSTPVAAGTVPSAPSALSATAGDSKVDLAWTAGAGATSYQVKRGTTPGSETVLASGITTTFYSDTTAVNLSHYFYVVVGVNSKGASVASNEVGPVSPAGPPSPPLTPTGLAATADTTPKVALTWTASVGATGYVVQRGPSGAGPFTVIGSPASNSFNDVTPANNTTYFYEVAAVNVGGLSAFSAAVSALTPSVAPSGLTAVPSATPLQVALNWTGSAGAVSYNVYRSTNGGGFTVIQNVAVATYTDATVANNTAYSYKITAVNAGPVESSASGSQAVTTAPAAPTGLSAIANTTPAVALTWTASAGANSYKVYRSVNAGPFTLLASPSTASYTDTPLPNNTPYQYEVSAVNTAGVPPGGEGAITAPVAATTPSVAPSGLTAVADNTPQIVLNWTGSAGATSYNIKRAVGAGPFSQYGTSGVTSFTDVGGTVANNQAYSYEVTAVNAGLIESLVSNQQTATTPPAAPSITFGVTNTPAKATISWTSVPGATSYSIYRGAAAGTETLLFAGIAAGTTSYNDITVANNTGYWYALVAIGAGGPSKASIEVNPIIPPAVPTGLGITALGTPQINLTWTAPAGGATSYKVFKNANPVPIVTGLGATNYSEFFPSVTDNTLYSYTVVATNAGGDSIATGAVSATTPPAPPAITSTVSPTNPQVTLNWATVAGNGGYNILRSGTSGTEVVVATIGAGSTQYQDTGIAGNNQTFFYKVQTTSINGPSRLSNEVSPLVPPGIPTAPSATPSAAPLQVSLTWSAPASGASSYNVLRSSGGPFGQINGGPILVTNFIDSTVVNAVSYTYQIVAVNGGGSGVPTPGTSATAPTLAPTGLVATNGGGTVGLQWNPTAGAANYRLYRTGVAPVSAQVLVTTTSGVSFTDNGVSGTNTYNYQVTAIAAGPNTVESLASNTAGPAGSDPTLPGPPSLNAANPGDTQVSLSWGTPSGSPTSYHLKRSTTPGGPYSVVGTPAGNSATDTGLTDGTTYYYVVSAINGGGEGSNSNELSATPNLPPGQPIISTVTPNNTPANQINWGTIPNASSYDIKRQVGGVGPFSSLGLSLPPATNTFLDSAGIQGNQTYAYIVTAINNISSTDSVASGSVLTPPLSPNLTSALASATPLQVVLNWNAPTGGATNYQVWRQDNNVGPAFVPLGGPTGLLTFTDSTAVNNDVYTYRLQALNATGPSQNSNTQGATTPTAAPTGLTGSIGNNVVHLNWTAPAGATTFHVLRGTAPAGPFGTLVGSPAATNFDDGSAVNGVTYYYEVKAINGGAIDSNPSNVAGPFTPSAGPTITNANPPNLQTGVQLSSNVELTFSMPMDHASTQAAITFLASAGPVPSAVYFWDATDTILTIVFDTNGIAGIQGDDLLQQATTYTVQVAASAHSSSGTGNLPMAAPYSTQFDTILDATSPQVSSYNPPLTSLIPSGTTQLDVVFNKNMDPSRAQANVQFGFDQTRWQGSLPVDPQDTGMTVAWFNATTLRLTFAVALPDRVVGRLQLNNVNDTNGHFYNSNGDIGFVTAYAAAASDTTPPKVTGTIPGNGAVNVARDTGMFVAFSEPIRPDVINHLTVTDNANNPLAGITFTMQLNNQPVGVQIQGDTALPAGVTLKIRWDNLIKDCAGNAITAGSVSFTTAAADATAPAVDAPYSTFPMAPNNTDIGNYGLRGEIAFVKNATSTRDYINTKSLSSIDVSIFDAAAPNIPVKGYTLDTGGDRGGLQVNSGQNFSGFQNSHSYILRLNTSLKNTSGVAIAQTDLPFTVVAMGGAARPAWNQVRTQYTTSPGGIHTAKLQVDFDTGGGGGPAINFTSLTAQDSPDLFNVATGSWDNPIPPGTSTSYQYKSPGGTPNETNLTTAGVHVVTYTVTDNNGHTLTVNDKGYLFSSVPSQTAPTGSVSGAITYSWGSMPAGADAVFIQVSQGSTPGGPTVWTGVVNTSLTSFAHPVDYPLTLGQPYTWSIAAIHFVDPSLNGGGDQQVMAAPLTFTPN